MKTVEVNADALRQVLEALLGPGHLIRELQAIHGSNLPVDDSHDPIGVLLTEYNEAAATENKQQLESTQDT